MNLPPNSSHSTNNMASILHDRAATAVKSSNQFLRVNGMILTVRIQRRLTVWKAFGRNTAQMESLRAARVTRREASLISPAFPFKTCNPGYACMRGDHDCDNVCRLLTVHQYLGIAFSLYRHKTDD